MLFIKSLDNVLCMQTETTQMYISLTVDGRPRKQKISYSVWNWRKIERSSPIILWQFQGFSTCQTWRQNSSLRYAGLHPKQSSIKPAQQTLLHKPKSKFKGTVHLKFKNRSSTHLNTCMNLFLQWNTKQTLNVAVVAGGVTIEEAH